MCSFEEEITFTSDDTKTSQKKVRLFSLKITNRNGVKAGSRIPTSAVFWATSPRETPFGPGASEVLPATTTKKDYT
ncbi:hypothetical protein CDAR_173881 [Caerostris darwini]|uniref:Uncharacterized protein n=1 Tax=Caerostris darwini TaxID=1538125 RepID=A0AAV4NWB5_9ARAC|nr:hypothetical protein CDAR_173881 [Caerostris darwini]